MNLTPSDVAVLAEEVGRAAVGGQVQKIRDGRDGEVRLSLRVPGETVHVLLATGSRHARLLVSHREPPRQPNPSAFVQLLRKHLSGSRLAAVAAHDGDRLVDLVFAARGDEGAETSWRLVAELTGRHGDLLLVDAEGRVRGALRSAASHGRDLTAGRPWTPPPPPPPRLRDAPTDLVPGAASERVEAEAEEALEREADETARTALERDLRKARSRVERLLDQLAGDQARADEAEAFQRRGELLQSAYGQVAPGAESVTVPDFYDPELRPVAIPLDPRRSLAESVARCFKEAKRRRAAREHIAPRRRAAEAQLAALDRALAQLGPELDADGAAALRRELESGRFLPRPRPTQARSGRRGTSPEPALPYWTFRSRTGVPILVGKSARDNDALTLKVARGRDLWLHVDGAAGSHVVVRLERDAEVDSETLADAALLAAHYSKRRGDTSVEVRYTLRKHVSKKKGTPPGLVTLAGARTFRVRLDDERLRRLFETRE